MKRRHKDTPETREGSLKRNNVYTTAAVQDWAARIHCGHGGIKMNEKYMLEVMAQSCNPRGVCELPVRYLADHIGVGLRQGQRIIQKLINYELVSAMDVAPQGRPNDIVRKFVLSTTIDPDSWEPPDGTQVSLMRRIREEVRARLHAALAEKKISDHAFMHLSAVHLVAVQSKRLDFVSPDSEVTDAVYKVKSFFLDVASKVLNAEVTKLHMIPKKGYRE